MKMTKLLAAACGLNPARIDRADLLYGLFEQSHASLNSSPRAWIRRQFSAAERTATRT